MPETLIKTIKDIKVGDFIKFVEKDKRGKFSYSGEVIKVDASTNSIETLCFEGNFGFNIVPSNELYLLDGKPVGWDKFMKNPDAYRKGLMEKEKAKEDAKAIPIVKTQKEQVLDIVKDNISLTENKLYKLVKSQVNGNESILKNYIKLGILKYKNKAP